MDVLPLYFLLNSTLMFYVYFIMLCHIYLALFFKEHGNLTDFDGGLKNPVGSFFLLDHTYVVKQASVTESHAYDQTRDHW